MGICLGSQVIFDYSEEGDVECLGLVKGSVKHFASVLPESEKDLKIPHMGWSSVDFVKNLPIFEGIPNHSDFYFVHSYSAQDCDSSVIAIYAMQFHPEKSAQYGLALLRGFSKC